MINLMIHTFLLIICAALFLLNVVAEEKSEKSNRNKLKMISFVKGLNIDLKEECYQPKEFFLMRDKGTVLSADPGKIEYKQFENYI